MTDAWISSETEPKEEDFRGIVDMHVRICKAIRARWGGPPYLYADLFAGPGHLEFNGRKFVGSPLIVPDIATRHGLDYESVCFEIDPATAGRLRVALADYNGHTTVVAEPCQEGFPRWLLERGIERDRLGLVYSDPIRDEIPHALLNKAAARFPKVDLLSYVAATQYKRRRGVNPTRPLLSEHIASVRKRNVLIREPIGTWQWTFILWSNWVDLPEWTRRGFHRLDTEKGARILDRLDLTEREQHETANEPLPFEPPYRSYREYLKHPRFLAVRAKVFARAAGVCERCKQRPPRDPHHLRYPPWGEFDVPENLIAICHECHCEIHGKAS